MRISSSSRPVNILPNRSVNSSSMKEPSGAGLYCPKTNFGASQYCTKEPFGKDLYMKRSPFDSGIYYEEG